MKRICCLLILILASPLVLPDNPSAAPPLKTEKADAAGVTGTFTLILFGGGHSNDVSTVAFLDLEGDGFELEPYAPAFDYRVEKGLPAPEALHKAQKFVGWHPSFLRSMLSKILDRQGNIVGYELRPLYFPLTFGASDVLDIDYWIKGGKIRIIIRTIPLLEKRLLDRDRSFDRDR